MSYAGLSDVTIRYRPITTMIGSEQYDVASVDVTSVFLASAESMVDAYLGRRYVTPLSYCPPLITQVTADLGIHAMLAEKLPEVPDFIEKRYTRAVDILMKLADGIMTLGNSVTTVSSQGDNYAWSNHMNDHSVFDPVLNPLDQRVDVDQVNAAKLVRSNDTDC